MWNTVNVKLYTHHRCPDGNAFNGGFNVVESDGFECNLMTTIQLVAVEFSSTFSCFSFYFANVSIPINISINNVNTLACIEWVNTFSVLDGNRLFILIFYSHCTSQNKDIIQIVFVHINIFKIPYKCDIFFEKLAYSTHK